MKFATALFLSVLFGGVCLLFTGCATPVQNTGFLDDGYEEFNALDDDGFKLRFVDGLTTETLSVPYLFILPEPKWVANPLPERPEAEAEVMFTIRERLYRYLLRNYPHPTRVRYAVRRDDKLLKDHLAIVITANVTDYTMGNGTLRYVVGYSAGRVQLQVEGEIFEGIDCEHKIGEYVFRVGHSGYAQSGLNTHVFDADYCMRFAAEAGIRKLTQELPRYLPIPESLLQNPPSPDNKEVSVNQ